MMIMMTKMALMMIPMMSSNHSKYTYRMQGGARVMLGGEGVLNFQTGRPLGVVWPCELC